MKMFEGLSAFPITPADASGRVDASGLGRLLERLVEAGVQSIGLLGSTGTYAYLSRAERRRAVISAVGCVGGAVPVIVGVGALRTDEAVALAEDAAAAGADGLLLAPVSYTPLTAEEVFVHFQAVAGATDLPLCIYNNPGTTHFTFDLELLQRLAEVPGIAAVKMPLPGDGDFAADLARLRAGLPDGFRIGYSGDWGCAAGLLAGADAWYSVVAGLLPGPTLALARAAMARDQGASAEIEAGFAQLWALFREFGSLRVVYAAAGLMGMTDCAPPRPIQPLPEAVMGRVAEALKRVEAVG